MARYQLPNGVIIQENTPFEIDQVITIPASGEDSEHTETQKVTIASVRQLSAAERAGLGITEIIEQPRPDDRYGFVNEDPENLGAWIVTPFSAEMLKDRLIAYSKDKRWRRETAGFDWNGIRIDTDDRSKMMIMGSRMAAQVDPEWTTQWAVGDTSVTVNATQMIAISDAAQAHVNGVFVTWNDVVTQINAGTITTYEAIDDAFEPA